VLGLKTKNSLTLQNTPKAGGKITVAETLKNIGHPKALKIGNLSIGQSRIQKDSSLISKF